MSAGTEQSRDQAAGAELVSSLFGLARALSLYEVNNAAIGRLIDGAAGALSRCIAEGGAELELKLLAEEFFVNGTLLHVDARLYERATELTVALQRFGIGSLTFSRECSRPDLERLASDWAASLRTGRSAFPHDGYPAISFGTAEGTSIASFRFDPERLALWLYASLVDLAEELYADAAAGHTPSLLEVKRVLQLIVDGVAHRGGLHQLLATVRDPRRPLARERQRVAIAVEALGFGVFLGLPKKHLLTLGLAGLLGGLSTSADPGEAVEPLLDFPGLGDAAAALVVAVYDARRLASGGDGGLLARCLALAESYVETTTGGTAEHPAPHPAEVVEGLRARGVQGDADALSELFAVYKGRYPLGSPVQLSDGAFAVVLAHPERPDGKERPVIARWLGDATLGEPIDLGEQPDLAIAATPVPAEAAIDLTTVRAHAAPPPSDAPIEVESAAWVSEA